MLRLLGNIYGRIANARNSLYDRGIFRSYPLGARTISIGNITTGGTGKTPMVARVAEILSDAGEGVCILTRGYGRDNARARVLVSDGHELLVNARTGGDEPVELAAKLIGKAIVIADADRVAAAAWAREQFGITAFVLDDGFQHRQVKRDLDVVCIDATDPFGGDRVLPAGKLREPLLNLSRADAIVLTRADLVDSIDEIIERLRQHNSHAPIFVSRNRITKLTPLDEFATEENGGKLRWSRLRAHGELKDKNEVRVFAFCALGNPDAFLVQLIRAFDDESMNDKFDLSRIKKFPDHHRYTQSDVNKLEQEARDSKIDAFLTTAKDGVKLQGLKFETPCFIAEIEPEFDDEPALRDLIISS